MKVELRHLSCIQWILLAANVVLFVTSCIFILTGGNLSLHSDSAAYVNLAAEQIRTGKFFPDGWYGSTGFPWLDIPLFITMRMVPNWLMARDLAQIVFAVLCFVSIITFSRKAFHNHSWLLIAPLLLMFVSGVQYDMMYIQCAYTFCIISIFLVLGSFFNALNDNLVISTKLRFSMFLILLFVVSLGGILTIQQITLPLLGAILILYMRNYAGHKGWYPPQFIEMLTTCAIIFVVSIIGCIGSVYLCDKMHIAGNMGLTYLSPSLEGVLQNGNIIVQGFLSYSGFQPGNSIFSLFGVQTLLRLFFMVAFTIIFPVIACKNFKRLSKQMQFFVLFVLVHCLEVYTLLLFGIGSDIAGSPRYQLTSIILLNIVSCAYIYDNYIKNERFISYIYVLGIVGVTMVSTLPVLNTSNYVEQLAQMKGLTNYLAQQNLYYGYATFWNAGKNTVLSNGKVQVNAVNISKGQIYKYLWLSSDDWYDPDYYSGKTFLLLTPEEREIYAPTGYQNTALGTPKQVLDYKSFTILVYDYNISTHQFGAEFRGEAEYIWKMSCSDQTMFQTDGSIQISDGQIMFGPYVDLESGMYTLTIEADCQASASINITAASGAKSVESFSLLHGKNTHIFELTEDITQVEFTVSGVPGQVIIIRSIYLKNGK